MALNNRTLRATYGGDLETRVSPDDHADLRLWLRVMTVHKLIGNEIRRRLRAEFGMSLARFDLMAQLERNPRGIRMVELSRRLMVTTGNITQLTDQLEREALVRRTPDPQHRRAFLICFTPKGRRLFAAIAKAHEAWIVELFAGLTRPEKQSLYGLLAKEKAALAERIAKANP
ncbi:MAG TPA: MarR family transcriptional regulator [Stellaceae bacterium]|nr:MarR family transcriptional regulator [Stellaceae bacterium]